MPNRLSMSNGPIDRSLTELRCELASCKLQLLESQREVTRAGQYGSIFANHPKPLWTFDVTSRRFLEVNDAAVRLYGYTVEEFQGMTIDDIRPVEDLPALDEALGLAPGEVAPLWRHRKKDGTVFEVELVVEEILLQGRSARIVMAQDASFCGELQLKRSLRALRLLSRCNQAMLHAVDEQQLLVGVCQAAVEIGGYELAWVGYARADDRKSIQRAASAGPGEQSLSELALSWEEGGSEGDWLPGRVVRSGRAEWCSDASRKDRHQSCLGLPLRHLGTTFGVLLLGSRDVLGKTPEEMQLMTELADNLAFGIQNLRVRREREQLEKAVLAVATGVSAGSGAQFFETLCFHLAEACGAAVAGVAEVIPDRPSMARTFACIAHGRPLANCEYRIADTPCEHLRSQDEYLLSSGLADQYPLAPISKAFGAQAYVGRRLVGSAGQMVGKLFALFTEPLQDTRHISAALRIFAARAASEIERKQAQTRVQEQAALLDAAHEAIYVRDLSDRVLFWNRAAEKLYGWSGAEAIGRPIRELVGGEPAALDEASRILRAQGEWRGEVEKRSREGRPQMVAVNWTLVRDEAGQPKAVLAINYDITEQKNLEAQLFRAQRLESLGTLAGGIAHDLNNVLAPITMAARLLQETVSAPDALDLLSTIQQSAQRAADLVRQMLTFARGAQGERIPVDLSKILQDLLQLMRETFPKSVTLEWLSDCEVATVCGDPTQLHQVFLNLCVNARDALVAGGRLGIRLTSRQLEQNRWQLPAGAYFGVEVEDTGQGIPLALQDRIFEPFFTTKEVGQGTGLGLSTAIAIVQSHKGALDVRSRPGQGSTFTVLLPAALSPSPTGQPTLPRAASKPRGNGELVLVVDDEPTLRRVLQRTLGRAGYRVLLAQDGVEALEIYQQHRQEIAVVLTDLAMPRMDGLSLVQALRSLDSNLKIIGTSGHGNSEAFSRLGVTHFLAKPCPTEVLLECLQELLLSQP